MSTQAIQTSTQIQANHYPNTSKSLGMSPSKALGSASNPNPSTVDVQSGCLAWLENSNNQAIHDQIIAGNHPLKSVQDETLFMDEWNYANATAYGVGQQGPTLNPLDNNQEQDSPQIPAGAKLGPNGNIVFAQEKAEADFQPSNQPIDVLSDEFTLNFPEKIQGGVTVEKTMDTRLNPATPVYKITVTDQNSVPKVTTYFVNSEAKLNINTVGGKGVELKEQQTFDSVVTVGTYQAPSKNGDDQSNPPASKDGKVNDTTGETEYVGQGSEVVDFFPQELAEDGKARTSKIWANANIVVPGGCHADVQVQKDSSGKVIETTVTIKDKDGKVTDIYKVEKGFNIEIQANKEYVNFGTAGEGADKPDGFDNVTLSGTETSTDDPTVDSPDDIVNFLKTTSDTTNDKQLLKALHDAGFTDLDSVDKLKDAIKNKIFPGKEPSFKLIKFLYLLDTNLATKMDKNTVGMDKDSEKQANSILVDYMQKLFPDEKTRIPADGHGIMMGNVLYVWSARDHQSFLQDAWVYKSDPSGKPTETFDTGEGYSEIH